MLNKILTYLVVSCFFIFLPSYVEAQECGSQYETVTDLHEPEVGTFSIWDATYGEGQRIEKFRSAAITSQGHTVVLGEMRPRSEMNAAIMLVDFDRSGRLSWEKFHFLSGITDVVKILSINNGYLVVANRHQQHMKKSIWIGFFDNKGDFEYQNVLQDLHKDLEVKDLIVLRGGAKFMLAVTSSSSTGDKKNPRTLKNGEVYIVDIKGKALVKRAFMMGGNSEILDLAAADQGEDKTESILATGYHENEVEKKTGMVMRLSSDASLVWQHEYSRGLASQINGSSPYMKDFIVTIGQSDPLDGGLSGAWAMLLSVDSGEVLWQRFYRGGYSYKGRSIQVNSDNLIILMVQADVSNDMAHGLEQVANINKDKEILGKLNYAHILILSPRGVTLSGQSYFNALGAEAYEMILNNEENIVLTGQSNIPFREIFDPVEDVENSKTLEDNSKKDDLLTNAHLPKANIPEGSLAGLALLNKKMSQTKDIESMPQGMLLSKDSQEVEQSVISNEHSGMNGWIVVGEGPNAYQDPCAHPTLVKP